MGRLSRDDAARKLYAALVTHIRADTKLGPVAFADRIGVPYQKVWDWESGRYAPDFGRIATGLGKDLASIMWLALGAEMGAQAQLEALEKNSTTTQEALSDFLDPANLFRGMVFEWLDSKTLHVNDVIRNSDGLWLSTFGYDANIPRAIRSGQIQFLGCDPRMTAPAVLARYGAATTEVLERSDRQDKEGVVARPKNRKERRKKS